jgi:UDP-N-acetyl-2-amino-2-deoxyglucuronate dehydrogenase
MRVLRTAIVGCGKVAPTHARAWQRLPGSELVAVCSHHRERAVTLAAQLGVSAWSDLGEMLRRERVDVLSVCTPHSVHVDAIETAAAAGVHVMCEKPLATDLASCDRALVAVSSARVKLGVVSQRRFYEPVRRVKDAIEAGRIGRPILAQVTVLGWRDAAYYRSDPWRGTWCGEGGGVMVSQCTHQIDVLLWFLGPVDELYGYCDNFTHPTIEVEDTAVAAIRFRSGAIATMALSNSVNPGLYGRIHVHGSTGASIGVQVESGSPFIAGVTARADPPFNDLWTVPGETHLLDAWRAEDEHRPRDVMTYYHELQLADFLDAVLHDREPLVSGADGRHVVEVFSAIYESARRKAPIAFPLAVARAQPVELVPPP